MYNVQTDWLLEKWSEDAVDFTRRRLESQGVDKIISHYMPVPTGYLDRVASAIFGRPVAELKKVPCFIPIKLGITSEHLRNLVGAPDLGVVEIPGNLLLNEGIALLEDLTIGAGGTAYDNSNAYIGVGDDNTAEAATQTELQAAQDAAHRFYKAQNASYPQRSSQTVSWQSDFTSGEANFAWQEWTVSSGATTASGSGFLVGTTNLNRKVASLGTKATGTWTFTGQVTIS